MNERLKPRPFCGKKPGIESWKSDGNMYMVKCNNPDCDIPYNGYPTGRVLEDVAEEWDRRAEND